MHTNRALASLSLSFLVSISLSTMAGAMENPGGTVKDAHGTSYQYPPARTGTVVDTLHGRAIADPYQRFEEDKLRLLRAVRFAEAFEFVLGGAQAAGRGPVGGENGQTRGHAEPTAAHADRRLLAEMPSHRGLSQRKACTFSTVAFRGATTKGTDNNPG